MDTYRADSNVTTLPLAGFLFGPDLSHFQGDPPLDALVIAGASLTITKATHGRAIIDGRFQPNWSALRTRPALTRGVYHWLDPRAGAEAQVDFYADTVLAASYGDLDFQPALDFEDENYKLLGPQATLWHLEAAIARARVRFNRKDIIVYTGKWFWQEYVGDLDSEIAAGCSLWHAQYPSARKGHNTDYIARIRALPPHAQVAKPWASRGIEPVLWQFDGDGDLVMPNGVDADFNRFVGDASDLAAFVRSSLVDSTDRPTPIPTTQPAHPLGAETEAEMRAQDEINAGRDPAQIDELRDTHPDGAAARSQSSSKRMAAVRPECAHPGCTSEAVIGSRFCAEHGAG